MWCARLLQSFKEEITMNYKFWFVVGSQCLYGPEVPETVETRAKKMAAELTKVLPYPQSLEQQLFLSDLELK